MRHAAEFKRVNVTIPVDVLDGLAKVRKKLGIELNLSAICSAALRKEVERLSKLGATNGA